MLWRKREEEDTELEKEDEEESLIEKIMEKLDDVEDLMDTLASSMKKVVEANEAMKEQYTEMLKREEDYKMKIAGLEVQLNIQNKFMQELILQLVNKPAQTNGAEPAPKSSVAEYIRRKNGSNGASPRLP